MVASHRDSFTLANNGAFFTQLKMNSKCRLAFGRCFTVYKRIAPALSHFERARRVRAQTCGGSHLRRTHSVWDILTPLFRSSDGVKLPATTSLLHRPGLLPHPCHRSRHRNRVQGITVLHPSGNGDQNRWLN